MPTSIINDIASLPVALTVDQVQKILGISRVSAYQLLKQPDFPAVRIGERRYVIPRDRFFAWLDKKANQGL